MPWIEDGSLLRHAAQMVRVCSRSGADVATFDVAEHVQALLLGILASHGVGVDACRTESLIHGDLRFDGRHDVGHGVDDGTVEFEEGDG